MLTGATFSLQNTKYSSCIKQLCQQPEFLEVRWRNDQYAKWRLRSELCKFSSLEPATLQENTFLASVNLSGSIFYLAREFPNPLFSFKVVIASFEYDLAIMHMLIYKFCPRRHLCHAEDFAQLLKLLTWSFAWQLFWRPVLKKGCQRELASKTVHFS